MNVLNNYLNILKSIKEKNIKISITNSIAQTLSQTINYLTQLSVMATGGYFIFIGILSLEKFIAFSQYASQFSSSLFNIGKLNTNIQQALASLERIFSMIDNFNYQHQQYGDKIIEKMEGNIKFDNVSFNYIDSFPVLKNVTIEIHNGNKISFVGKSGSGKTTIFNLLLRLYDVTAGDILLDNIKIQDLSEETLRRNIAVVMQEPFLFSGTILENLLMGKPDATDDEIEKACKLAYIHDYICSLPGRYNSLVGQNGINMSVGQKQRIAIARAILKNATVILFDEATSSLDNESQFNIKKALDELSKDHTIVIIAHRLLTVIDSDEIFVIENGEVVGRGSHKYLINENEAYKELFMKEFTISNNHNKEGMIV